ncbi:hypothetical protein VP1G_10709 [Cytospora mali]|uniref:Uncharacterized protein n=1 Tax=Cytospora mali TaxID=578113 RepID=A0A194UTS3_CYTMA|nr:hypothetical protein VP1G_10709 [Valsa mali var. pyri (nom. inval.)]
MSGKTVTTFLSTAFGTNKSKLDGKQPVHLQVNAKAKSQGLNGWVRNQGSKGTHSDLAVAVAVFDTNAQDQDAGVKRVQDSLAKQARDNLVSGNAAKQTCTKVWQGPNMEQVLLRAREGWTCW